MSLYRNQLPQLSGDLFLTDGGIETDLIFHQGVQLPYNAAYVLLENDAGIAKLTRYFEDYVSIARQYGAGLILESPTWRANSDWADKIGTSQPALAEINRKAIDLLASIRLRHAADGMRMVLSGCIGPRSDGYRPTEIMSPVEAERYHASQIAIFRDTEADMVAAFTLTNIPEAVGIARGARTADMPAAISFTVETDGRLPTGPSLREAIEEVDDATDRAPAYYMINCAHPTHFEPALAPGEVWTKRIRGLRANSSCRSHAELDESPQLDEGNPRELAANYKALLSKFPHINVLGGCCGTDARHIKEIAAACVGR